MAKPRPYYRQAVLAVLVNQENKVLIGTSPRDGGHKMPQGGIKEGEEPKETLVRELYEELAIQISEDNILKRLDQKVGYAYPENDDYYIYIGQELTVFLVRMPDNVVPTPQDDEFGKLYWIRKEELLKFDVGFRKEAYQLALEMCL